MNKEITLLYSFWNLVTWPRWHHMNVFLAIFSLKLQKTCCYQRQCGNYDLRNIATVRRRPSAFQRGVNQVSIISSSWDLLNEIIFAGSHSATFRTFFSRKLITAMLFGENASKYYYVNNEIMKRLYLFDIVLLLVGYVFCYIKTSTFLSIFWCFCTDFTGLNKRGWRQHILKDWLRNTKVI